MNRKNYFTNKKKKSTAPSVRNIEENGKSNYCICQGFTCKAQQKQQWSNHNHGRKIRKNIQAGGGGSQTGVDLLHKDHAV